MSEAPRAPGVSAIDAAQGSAIASLALAAMCVAAGLIGLLAGGDSNHGRIAVVMGCHVPLLLAAWQWADTMTRDDRRDGLAIRLTWTILLHVSVVVGVLMALGVAHLISRGSAFLVLSLTGLGAHLLAWRQAKSSQFDPGSGRRLSWFWLPVTLAATLVATRAVLHPQYDFDELTYHLFFPSQWAQAGSIHIVPTWFSDPAPAYAPSATEVYFLSLMVSLESDHLARCGQLIFWIELLAVVAALGRELGLRSYAAGMATVCVAATPSIAFQAGTAMVDVALAAHLAAAALFALRVARRSSSVDGAGLLLAGGLALGTKFLALPYLLALSPVWILAIVAMKRRWRQERNEPNSLVLLGGLVLGTWNGGYWYARNWLQTGSPLYPLEMRIAGVKLFDGAFTREAMQNSMFNQSRRGWDGLNAVMASALRTPPWFGATPPLDPSTASTLASWTVVITTLASTLALLVLPRMRRRAALISLAVSTAAMVTLFWWAVPFQEPRFTWLPVILAILTSIAVLDGFSPKLRGVLVTVFAIAWLCLLGGEWVATMATGAGCVVAALALAAYMLHVRTTRSAIAIYVVLVIAGVWVGLWSIARNGDPPRKQAFALPRWSGFGDAWSWIDSHVNQATIAYTGNNVPYFLTGPHQQNRVVHVLADEHQEKRYHDFAQNADVRALGLPNVSDFAPNRLCMDGRAWLRNLAREDVNLVVVTRLFPAVCVSHRHDADGFPVERRWLDTLARTPAPDGRPLATRGVFGREWLLLYRLNLPTSEADWPDFETIVQDETDALDRRRKDRTPVGQPINHYPHAAAVIDALGLKTIPANEP